MASAPPSTNAGAAPKLGVAVDPYRNYNFLLQIPSVAAEARFVECAGLGMRIEPIAYRESGAGQAIRALPGPVRYGEVTLRYGLTKSLDLWRWLIAGASGAVQRRNVSIAMLELNGSTEAFRWNLLNAWICEWRGAQLDALGHEAAIEEIHLAFDSLERA